MNLKKTAILFLAIVILCAVMSGCDDESKNPSGEQIETQGLTVNCYFQGTSQAPTPLQVMGGSVLLPGLPNRDGHTFKGLFDAPEGGSMVVDANGVTLIVIQQPMTLYAQFTPNPYYLVFDAQGGALSSAGDEREVKYGDTVSEFPTASKEGYTFVGWEDANGTRYSDKASVLREKRTFSFDNYTPDGDTVRLFAVYETAKYTVTFDYNDGTYRSTSITVEHGQTIPADAYPQEGLDSGSSRVFAWAVTSNGTQSFMGAVKNDMTLFAIWKDYRSFTLSDTVGNQTTVCVYRDEPFNLLTYEGMTRPGYYLEGWYTSVQYSGNPVTEITYGSYDKTYYAKWSIATYSLVFDQATAGKAIAPITYHMGDAITLEIIDRNGLTFKGWSPNADGSGEVFTSLPATFYGDHTLYAIFEPVFFDVTLWSDGGTLSSGNGIVSVEYGKSYRLPVPEKTGYVFQGWFDGVGDGAARLTNANGEALAAYETIGAITAYARWTPVTYTVSFQTNGGSSVASATYTHGSKLTLPTEPTLNGRIFDGWYTDEALTERLGTDYRVTADVTLYANWIISTAISSVEDLQLIALNPDANFHLTRDINLGGVEWTMIPEFRGVLDGKGHKIHNFTISANASAGFIATNTGTIRNLTLSDFNFTATGGHFNVGMIAATNSGTITNCTVTDGVMTVKGSGEANGIWWELCCGAVCGNNSGNVIDCKAEITVTVDAMAYNPYQFYNGNMNYWVFMGGAVGRSSGTVRDSYADCVLSASAGAYGTSGPGGAGSTANATIVMGGLLGRNEGVGVCDRNQSEGSTTFYAISYKGFNGVISAYAGGLVGQNYGSVDQCVAKGTVEIVPAALNAGGAGGLVGVNCKTVMNSYADVSLKSCNSPIGGFVHQNEGTISNCYSLGTLEVTTDGTARGGFVAINNVGGNINKCFAAGNMVGATTANTATFVAAEAASSSYFKCYYSAQMVVIINGIPAEHAIYNGVSEADFWIKTEFFIYDTLAWGADVWCIPADGYPILLWQQP